MPILLDNMLISSRSFSEDYKIKIIEKYLEINYKIPIDDFLAILQSLNLQNQNHQLLIFKILLNKSESALSSLDILKLLDFIENPITKDQFISLFLI